MLFPELTINPRKIGEFVTEADFDGAYDFSAMTVREVFGKDEDVGKLSFVAKEAKQFYPFPRTMMAPIDNYEDAFASIAKEPKTKRTKLALTYQLMLDRVPLLYAGNELGSCFTRSGRGVSGRSAGFFVLEGCEGAHCPPQAGARTATGELR